MVKAIILDDEHPFKKVVMKFGGNYRRISLSHFLNLLCERHNFDYWVRTARLKNIKNEATVGCFETLNNMSYFSSVIQSCEEFDNLWESYEIVEGISID